MKKIITLLLIAATFSACKKDCDDYHEGKKCDTEVRVKYYGDYNGSFSTSNGTGLGTSVISEGDGGAETLKMDGLNLKLKDENTFEIPRQTIAINGGAGEIRGAGTIEGDLLSYYSVVVIGNQSVYAYFSGTLELKE